VAGWGQPGLAFRIVERKMVRETNVTISKLLNYKLRFFEHLVEILTRKTAQEGGVCP
jgi:hypothetical protein